MTDILEEILNEEKDAKRLRAFRKIFPFIIILTIIGAITIGGYNWYSSSKTKHNQEAGDSLIQLLAAEHKNKKLITNLLEEISNNKENKIAELAAIKLAGGKLYAGGVSEAAAFLEKIIGNKEHSEITRSYARIMYISLMLELDNLTNDQENKSREYLQYFNKDIQLFYSTATLLKALFYMKNKQYNLAKEYADETLRLPRASMVIKEQARAIIFDLSNK